MSNATQRAALIAAADGVTVGDFTVHAYDRRPATMKPGDAWVRWRGAERADGFAFINTWAVIVIVSGEEQVADDMADQLAYALAGALEPVMFIDAITPVAQATSAGDMNAIQIMGKSE